MSSLIGSIFSETSDVSADQTIAFNSANAAAASAQAYLSAALTATTPEIRRMYLEFCNQFVMGQEAVMGLIIKNNWANPYDTPEKQLQSVLQQSKPSSSTNQH